MASKTESLSPDFRLHLQHEQSVYTFLLQTGAELVDGRDEISDDQVDIATTMVGLANIAAIGVARGYYSDQMLETAGSAIGTEPHAVMINLDDQGNFIR